MASDDQPPGGELPIGRRMAQWRVRRRMTQQVLADRLGKSKSWVDKVERGVRALDKVSVLNEVAEVLRVDPVTLLGQGTPPPVTAAATDGVEGVRAALAIRDAAPSRPGGRLVPSADAVARQVEHAWLAYQHARYPQVLRLLPDLLGAARHRYAGDADPTTGLLVQAYRITAQVLVKLGEADLGWLAADRAVNAAGGDPLLTAAATVPLGAALRTLDRPRLALAATLAAADRAAPPMLGQAAPVELSVCGTLLVEAALAAADCPEPDGVADLLEQAAELARLVGDGHDHQWTGFGPTAVELARTTAAALLGAPGDAVDRYERATGRNAWQRLPVEHRAAHLLDVARAYLDSGDPSAAGRLLVEADRIAPAEVRVRPVARDLVTTVTRSGAAPAGLLGLATAIGAA
ncbi:helix-turn-helix domain-containing protein [Micromonospora fluostatini]|uniref:helix-turn-helix domain-containing protein n=1 Tax=Micromonospora sp. JCM 30529 TaxID=3421643 RepID=UPI003D168B49